jgi:hypothetical protein
MRATDGSCSVTGVLETTPFVRGKEASRVRQRSYGEAIHRAATVVFPVSY